MVNYVRLENNSTICLSNAPIRLVNMCTGYKWGSGITPKTPGHASLDMTQQSERLTLHLFGGDNITILHRCPADIDNLVITLKNRCAPIWYI